MAPRRIVGTYAPLNLGDDVSIAQFMTYYNPDNVPPEKVAHVDTIAGRSLTYGGLRTIAARCAWGLQRKLGLKEQDVVLAVFPNSTDFIILAHSAWWAGVVFSAVNALSTASDIARAIDIVKPSHVAVTGSDIEKVRAAIKLSKFGKKALPKIFTVLDRVESLMQFPEDIAGRTPDETLPPYDLRGKSAKQVPAFICFSSGTTGKTKGTMLSHFNLIVNVLQCRIVMPSLMSSTNSEVFFAPYCHIDGFSVVVVFSMWLGSFICSPSTFDLHTFCSKMAEYRANCAHIVPPVVTHLASPDIPKKYDLSTLRTIFVSAAPLKCSPVVAVQNREDETGGSVGKLLPGTEARLVGIDTGKDVAVGEEGELWVRGPQVTMQRGTFAGEWLRTGDISKVDENNNFWVTDRLKEMIKYKGFQVAPSELEDLLLQHPDVTDAAVCSTYDYAQATELPLAYVSLKGEHAALPKEQKDKILDGIRKWHDARVAGYKKLRGGIFHLQNLPKTPSGKILRRYLPVKLKERESKL
ncbi:putative amp dependent CoA ligase [Thermoascus aurantiacus ATCC 26904]